MAGLPEWVSQIPAIGKWIAGTVAGLAATVAGWTAIGGPIPADRAWVQSYVSTREEVAELRAEIATTRSLLAKAENAEVREGLEARLRQLEADLERIEG